MSCVLTIPFSRNSNKITLEPPPPRTDCLSDYLTDSMARRTTEGMANGSMAFITSLATRCVGHNQLIT